MRKFAGNFALIICSTVFALLLAELVMQSGLVSMGPLNDNGQVNIAKLAEQTAKAKGQDFDARSTYQVIADDRAKGIRSYPALSPAYYMEDDGGSKIEIAGKKILPLGIVPNASTYYCNESGKFADFKTDRFGFRNPDALWDSKSLDIVAVGDSFAFGSCLPEQDGIVGQIRKDVPNTINLGIGANGPLIELAAVREFVKIKKPKVVLWFFFDNDLDDLKKESKNKILQSYLRSEYSQNLMDSRVAVNQAVERLSEEYFGKIEAVERAKTPEVITPWYKLPRIRAVMANFRSRYSGAPEKPDLKMFAAVIRAAKDDVSSYGGKLYFVYMPDCANSYAREGWQDQLFNVVKSFGIPIIDTLPGISALKEGGYFYCPGSHFNASGAKTTADLILQKIASEN